MIGAFHKYRGDSLLQNDDEPRFLRLCKRQIKDSDQLDRTIAFFEFAKSLNDRPQWSASGAKTMGYLVRMPLTKGEGGVAGSLATAGFTTKENPYW
jgi:hypothetical protein